MTEAPPTSSPEPTQTTTPEQATEQPTEQPTATVLPTTPIKHIFVIILENKSKQAVFYNSYFNNLAKQGVQLTHYYGVSHPSEPNYLAMIAGDTFVTDDGSYNLPQTNLVDLMEQANVTWKAYLEDYPGSCFAGGSADALYARKHNPFISFDDVRTDVERCSNLVNADQLDSDIAAGQLPQFSFYVPNLKNDGHDTSVDYSANWLQSFLDPKLADPHFMDGTLVMITFDETDDFNADPSTQTLYAVLLGPMVQAGTTNPTPYTHYSLLRTVEDTFNLGTLRRNDESATPFDACIFSGGCAK